MARQSMIVAWAVLAAAAGSARAQDAPAVMSEAAQIASAVMPLPAEFRESATVLGYRSGQPGLVTLKQGDGAYICLATDPADTERFHVACYHRSLEPFMARGREIRAGGVQGEAVDQMRNADIEAGRLKLPEQPAALYSLTGTVENVDAQTGAVEGARPLYVVYIPFATPESTGLPATPSANAPWLMNPGTAKAHIMFIVQM